MSYLGDFADDSTVSFAFTTNAADGGRESFSASLEEADIVIFKDGTAMTLDASTITITTDIGSRTGVHIVSVDMSNDADFTTGADYTAVLYASDETLDSQAPAGVLASWSCENRSVNVSRISGSSTAADNAEVVFDTDFSTNYNATRNAWATNVQDTVGSGNLPADVLAISTDATAADNLEAACDGTGFDIGGIDVSELNSIVDDLLDGGRLDLLIDGLPSQSDITGGAYALNTDASGNIRIVDGTGANELSLTSGLIDGIAGTLNTFDDLNDLSTSDIDARLAAIGLDHLLSTSVTGTDVADNSIFARLVSSGATADWDNFVNTSDSLQAIRDHVGDGSNLTEAGGTGDQFTAQPWNSAWDAEVQSEVADALAAYNAMATTDLPSNFADLAITSGTGRVTVGTNTDKTGYSISGTKTTLDDLEDVSQSDITGGAYSLDTDANGRVRIVDGTGTGELDTSSGLIAGIAGTIQTLDALDTAQDAQHASTQSDIADLNNLSAADVNAQVDAAIEDYHLDHLFASTYDPSSKPGASDALLNELVENDGGVARFTANSLELAPTGGSAPSAATIADAVLDEALSGHATAGTLGQAITDLLTGVETDIPATLSGLNDLDATEIRAALGLASANLDTQIAGLPTQAEITGGSYALDTDANGRIRIVDGTGTGEIDTASGEVIVASLGTQAKADVNAEMVDVIATDTYAEPGQETPGATVSLATKIGYTYKFIRNKRTQTSALLSLYNDDGTTVGQTATVSDDGTTLTVAELTAGT